MPAQHLASLWVWLHRTSGWGASLATPPPTSSLRVPKGTMTMAPGEDVMQDVWALTIDWTTAIVQCPSVLPVMENSLCVCLSLALPFPPFRFS